MTETETIAEKAARYARATTNTRCARMGECEDCGTLYCDYKSRARAYSDGWRAALCGERKEEPWDSSTRP